LARGVIFVRPLHIPLFCPTASHPSPTSLSSPTTPAPRAGRIPFCPPDEADEDEEEDVEDDLHPDDDDDFDDEDDDVFDFDFDFDDEEEEDEECGGWSYQFTSTVVEGRNLKLKASSESGPS
jgi:hypothetical protein